MKGALGGGPLAVAEVVKAELLGHLGGRHGVRQVLLVGENEEHGVAHLILIEHLGELLAGVLDTIAIVAVNDVDQAVGAGVIVPGQVLGMIACRQERAWCRLAPSKSPIATGLWALT